MDSLEIIIKKNRAIINKCIKSYFSTLKEHSRLRTAMMYGVSNGGKRMRPFLVIELGKFLKIPKISYLNLATAIEFIHCYSLIHDDLPQMDNDNFRRGRLTTHKKFDEATAILAGSSLYCLAIEILSSKKTHPDSDIRSDLCRLISEYSGIKGLAQGQSFDIIFENKYASKKQILNTYMLKTSKLFEISLICPFIMKKSSKKTINNARVYGRNLGIIYQIVDDLLDLDGDFKEIGKTSGKDRKSKKNTLVEKIGREASIQLCYELANEATCRKKIFGSKHLPFKNLIYSLITRKI